MTLRDDVLADFGKPSPDLPAKSRRDYLEPAEPGKVWMLTHTWSPVNMNGTGYVEPNVETTPYLDPRTAMKDLADWARREWPRHVGLRRGVMERPPADDMETVAVFFRNPTPRGTPVHDTFEMVERDVVTKRTPIPVGAPEYVLIYPHGEITCQCGNESTGYGFYPCDAYGRGRANVTGPVIYVGCWQCGRVIEQDTGRVVTRLPLCKNCGNLIVLVPLLSRQGCKEAGDLAWKHVGEPDCEEHIRCADAHHVSHDGVAAPNV